IAKQSPPMPVICGSTTQSTATAATAASAALPPARSVSIAVSEASGCEVAAMASPAMTAERPGRWKSRVMQDRFRGIGAGGMGKVCDCEPFGYVPFVQGETTMSLTLAQARSILDKTLAACRE